MKNSIELTQEQRELLEEVISTGKAAARTIQHAQILMKIDSGKDGPNKRGISYKHVNYLANQKTFFRAMKVVRALARMRGLEPISSLCELGFVFGIINEGLTYASPRLFGRKRHH